MKSKTTKLTLKEFLTLYSSVIFKLEDMSTAIEKVFNIKEPSLDQAVSCTKKFEKYINEKKPELLEKVKKTGLPKVSNEMSSEQYQKEKEAWLLRAESILGKEIEIECLGNSLEMEEPEIEK